MNIGDGSSWIRAKLERSYEKLMPEAKEIVSSKKDFLHKMLESSCESYNKEFSAIPGSSS